MASQGSVFKRCTHDGKTRETGKPATSRRKAIRACPCDTGSWWWRIDAGPDPVTGARRQPTRGSYLTKALAQAGLDEIRDQIRRGTIAHDDGHTVASWLRKWIADGARDGRWEPTTLADYRSNTNLYLIPLLGHLRLRDLRRTHVGSMLATIAAPDETRTHSGTRGGRAVTQRSPLTVDRIRRTLRAALGDALLDDLVTVNAAAGRFRQIGRRGGPSSTDWWQPAELQAFLDHVTDDPDLSLWTVVALTGLRRGEACGLRWTDVDLTGPHPGLWVRQKVVQVEGQCHICGRTHRGRQIRPGAKSTAGDRWVPLIRLAVVELTTHRATQDARRTELGDHWSDHGLVWPADGSRIRDLPGSPRHPGSVGKRHAALIAEVGLKKIKLHSMRHGAISLLAAAGMPADQIALIVGHADPNITREVYMHPIWSELHDGAQAAADLLHPRTDRP